MNTALRLVKPELTTFGTPDSFSTAWNLFTEEVDSEGQALVEPSEEYHDALKSFYDDIKENLQEKADEFVYIIKDAQAQEKSLKTEAARLQARAKQFAAKADKVKELLRHAMETSDVLKVKTDKHTLNVQKPGGKAPIDIYAETLNEIPVLPEKYLQEVTKTIVLNDVLRADLKAGVEVEGACLATRDKILVIK